MIRRFAIGASALLAALLVGTISGSVALAQPPPFGGPGGGGPGMGGPGRRGPRQETAAQAPLAALKAGLKLTAAQTARIQKIQSRVRQQRDALMPRPGGGNNAPPDFNAMRARFDKMRASEQKADKEIAAALSTPQRQALPGLLKRLGIWRQAGIPAELYGTLNLTGAQQQKIAAIVNKARAARSQGGPGRGGPGGGGPGGGGWGESRQKVHSQAMAALTAGQRKTVTAYLNAHPRPQFGRGPGGFGGGFPPR
jgi:Spy/CpxP family protein refolding chaperone